ncbi:MAG: hypothetical protein K1060chlam4_00014 [Candidatus Anoxychlamydiales bacterium]|nr:hypothetical protein [Candidatus Anoxychlamydiales bacterium]NGX52968.1 hypothetical protein [Candidatus Anoxychlamydiales bacterium]
MKRKLTRKALFNVLKKVADKIPEHRNINAPNLQHPIQRAVMSCFAAFYLQQPSLLSHEKKIERKNYKHNFKKLFY